MQRETSIAVYRQIEAEGLLSRMRWLVYRTVFRHGPMTVSECFELLEKQIPNFNWNTRTRFTELKDMGVLTETGTRECNVTGRVVLEYDVTSHLPSDFVKPKSKLKRLEEEVAFLTAENKLLNVRLKFLRDLLNRKKAS